MEREPFTIFVRMGARMGRDDLTQGCWDRIEDTRFISEEIRETISSSDNYLNWWK